MGRTGHQQRNGTSDSHRAVFCHQMGSQERNQRSLSIVIGNPLKSSPDFPPLCTERAAFTALGAPSNSDVRASNTTYTLRYSFKFKD